MRAVLEALIALSASPNGFTASQVAARVCTRIKQSPSQYGPRPAAYDLKKLRGKDIIRRIGHTRRYEPVQTGLKAMTALLVLYDKAIKPLLAAAQPRRHRHSLYPCPGLASRHFGAKPDQKICRRSGGDAEFMEDPLHGRLNGIVVEIDGLWIVCAARGSEARDSPVEQAGFEL
jgi:hypothetical protein